MSLFIPPNARATDANSNSLSGALWYFYTTGTTTPAAIYTTSALNVAHANPVVADSGGKFANIFLDPAVTYRAVLKTAAGTTLNDIDPYGGSVSQAELSADSGFTLIKYKYPASGTYSRTLAEMELAGMLGEGVSVMHWIDPAHDAAIRNFTISGVDLADELNAALAYLSGNARLATIPDGIFPVASTVNIGNGTLRLRGTNYTVLKYTGAAGATTAVLSADRGSTGSPGNLVVEGLILDGNALAGRGLYNRGCPHSTWRNIRTRNVTKIGFYILGDVGSTYESLISSSNYSDQTTNPENCLVIDGTAAVTSSTSLVFLNPILEGSTSHGIDLFACDNSLFIAGTAEGCGGAGIRIGANCTMNEFRRMFCEINTSGDVECYGDRNLIDGVFNSLAGSAPYISVPSVQFFSGANQNRLSGRAFSATIDSGATNTDVSGTFFRAFTEQAEADLTDNGTGTTKHFVGTATWDPASIASGAQATTTVTVQGAAVGDEVSLSFSNSLAGLILTGYVSAANTVTAVLANLSGGAVDLASGTLTATVA